MVKPRSAKPLAYGRKSAIYEIDGAHILKLYNGDIPPDRIKMEYAKTLLVWKTHRLNIPRPISLVSEMGKRGIVFERIIGNSYMDLWQRKPWTTFTEAKKIAGIHKKIHELTIDGLPTQEQEYSNLIKETARINERDKEILLTILNKKYTPVLCHGDFHQGNLIKGKNSQTYIIDWMEAFAGSYLLDVSLTAVNAAVSDSPRHIPAFFRVAYEILKKTIPLDKYYLQYYGVANPKDCQDYLLLAAGIHLSRFEGNDHRSHLKYFRQALGRTRNF